MDECEAFNIVNQGMCKTPLDDRGECPRQGEHGDEFDVPKQEIADADEFDETAQVTLEIDNIYEDGERIQTRVETRVPMPPRVEDKEAFSEWEQDYLMPHTGTGRPEGDAAYFVKIVESDDPELLGHEAEFGT